MRLWNYERWYHISGNDTIAHNVISGNNYGVCVYESDYNTISKNNIVNNNEYGIYIFNADNNTVYYNNLSNNTFNAFDMCENIWYNTSYNMGNYWNDFDEPSEGAYDNDTNGIVDTPYEIPGGDNKDMCPLINQWPNSKSRVISRNTPSYDFYWLRFLERFPLLERLLNLI